MICQLNFPPVSSVLLRALLVLCVLVFTWSALAASTVDTFTFDSVATEDRYRGLIAEIRCPKCQNVNIAGSDAPIAKDLRVTVHRLLSEGLSDQEILDYLQARYGDFVLYDPPMRSGTLLLWLIPLLGFIGVVVIVLRMARRSAGSPGDTDSVFTDALTEADAQQLEHLLARTGGAAANAKTTPPESAH